MKELLKVSDNFSGQEFCLKIKKEDFPENGTILLTGTEKAKVTKLKYNWWRKLLLKMGFSVVILEAKIINNE